MNRSDAMPTLIALVALTLSACEHVGNTSLRDQDLSGVSTTVAFDAEQFTGIDLRGDANVTVVLSEEFSVSATTDSALAPYLVVDVRSGVLVLGQNYHFQGDDPEVAYTIHMPSLTSIEVSGSGAIDAAGVPAGAFRVELSGSGSVSWNAALVSLNAEIAGSGTLFASGSAEAARVEISGSGDFYGTSFTAVAATVEVDGSGDVDLIATGSLAVEINGSGNVTYGGEPIVTRQIDGSGTLKRR